MVGNYTYYHKFGKSTALPPTKKLLKVSTNVFSKCLPLKIVVWAMLYWWHLWSYKSSDWNHAITFSESQDFHFYYPWALIFYFLSFPQCLNWVQSPLVCRCSYVTDTDSWVFCWLISCRSLSFSWASCSLFLTSFCREARARSSCCSRLDTYAQTQCQDQSLFSS